MEDELRSIFDHRSDLHCARKGEMCCTWGRSRRAKSQLHLHMDTSVGTPRSKECVTVITTTHPQILQYQDVLITFRFHL